MPIVPDREVIADVEGMKGRRRKKFLLTGIDFAGVNEKRKERQFLSPEPPRVIRCSNYPLYVPEMLIRQRMPFLFEKVTAYTRRKQRVNDAAGSYTQAEWDKHCADAGFKCLCCGRADVPLTIDHVVPLSQGGSHWIANLQALCRSCNSSKGVKRTDYRPYSQHP